MILLRKVFWPTAIAVGLLVFLGAIGSFTASPDKDTSVALLDDISAPSVSIDNVFTDPGGGSDTIGWVVSGSSTVTTVEALVASNTGASSDDMSAASFATFDCTDSQACAADSYASTAIGCNDMTTCDATTISAKAAPGFDGDFTVTTAAAAIADSAGADGVEAKASATTSVEDCGAVTECTATATSTGYGEVDKTTSFAVASTTGAGGLTDDVVIDFRVTRLGGAGLLSDSGASWALFAAIGAFAFALLGLVSLKFAYPGGTYGRRREDFSSVSAMSPVPRLDTATTDGAEVEDCTGDDSTSRGIPPKPIAGGGGGGT